MVTWRDEAKRESFVFVQAHLHKAAGQRSQEVIAHKLKVIN